MGSDKRISLISSHLAHAVVTYSLIFLIGLQCVGGLWEVQRFNVAKSVTRRREVKGSLRQLRALT